MTVDRRDLFKIVAAGATEAALAQQFDPKMQKPRFFTAEEYDLIDALCETILPADAESGGARDAGVRYFIDTVVFHGPNAVKEFWRTGLAAATGLSREMYGKPFTALDPAQRDAVMTRMLGNERSPSTPLDRFAVRLKAATIEAYSVSATGMKHFRHEGSHGFEFRGCSGHGHSGSSGV